ncbi:HNHc domain containing protein [uncultured Caudovirales phage]|uniref:HNHc domain containing protein n=1 Tax=uncultured Caudovirales phage TaxID=2100421 RepID=A0A6J5REJ7_9CAUD|nr:HNHc domain containing protein [uncultured Caudovirales phage]CAB4167135.1 HNHc domain containing protein [uncultured Caudovirales phage]CAB4174741.1 HNHc domain containing protein [uncultured Caudovirales phage]CAB4180089.1 HNHc domain containing protein [uncultured Caudovirales phage]CAB4186282.1 HNHc domain containing protein [uncultured Caudovirales phage]
MARSSADSFRKSEKDAIWARENGICQYCSRPISSIKEAEFHHAQPVWKGGDPHDTGNGMLLHATCHRKNYNELHPGAGSQRNWSSTAAKWGARKSGTYNK